ncbi:MAG TPA: chloride channel protein [Gemmatimonadales bacterium]|nr:chloride channel protein [Gemmatimonadales bacterium]
MTTEGDPAEIRGDFTVDGHVLILSAIGAAIGAAGGVVAFVLVRLIGFFTNLFYFHRLATTLISPAGAHPGWWSILIPVGGGVVVGLMARYGSAKIRGHGIPEAIEAILMGGSRIEANVAVLKPLSSAIAMGTGGPFGAEGPIIRTGGAVGSLVAQAFHLSSAERKTLLVAGASAGMTAIFGTPVAAVILAVELLLFEWKPRSFIPVAAASAVAALIRPALMGSGPLFPVVPHSTLGTTPLLASLALGVAVGIAAALITELVYTCEDLFQRLPVHWMWWPAIGGIAVGIGGVFFPRALGVGYDTISAMLHGDLVTGVLLGLLITKALIWAIALSSGTSGGVLAPLLIVGGSLGAIATHVLPGGDPRLYALVGMGAMIAGAMHAPFTAIVLMAELTGDFAALPALLIACVAADTVTVLTLRRSILTEKLARRGQHVTREYIVNPLHLLRVEEVMERKVPTLPSEMLVDQLLQRLSNEDPVIARRQAWPVVDPEGRLVGLVTRSDLVTALEGDDAELTLGDIGSRKLVVAYPDELLEEATQKMLKHDIGRLPVVRREDPTHLVGYLGRPGIMAAWVHATREERMREPGWLTARLGAMRGTLKRALVGKR